jgi:hypothetical protein
MGALKRRCGPLPRLWDLRWQLCHVGNNDKIQPCTRCVEGYCYMKYPGLGQRGVNAGDIVSSRCRAASRALGGDVGRAVLRVGGGQRKGLGE